MVRQAIVSQYGEEAYTRGFNVTTTVRTEQQQAAYRAVRAGLFNYEQRQIYRGPERFIELPTDKAALDDAIDDAIAAVPDNGDLYTAVVLSANPNRVVAVRQDGVPFNINKEGLLSVQPALSAQASPKIKIRPGAVIRVMQNAKKVWFITQQPEVEAAFVAMDPRNGAIRALIGGFDFQKTQFNHVTQAWRQPGSSFKPFIYSAALERGVTPSTIVNDAPLSYSAAQTGGQPWEPKNYDGEFAGPMSLRRALALSKNMVSIRVLEVVGTQSAQDWVTRFGFDAARHPPYLTLALGAGSVTPMQMATGYSVFANGGYLVQPQLISQVTDHRGRVLFKAPSVSLTDQPRAIDERNAFVMNSLLQEITRSGTAARAQSTLQRSDLFGKTGTTNDSVDAWFVGFQPHLVAATWVGYGTPRNLGARETGGGLSLPIWMDFMKVALSQEPIVAYPVPAGVIQVGGEWYFEEFGPSTSIRSLGMDANSSAAVPTNPEQVRQGVIDLFRN
jgi:penicillin-binding protein 1A